MCRRAFLETLGTRLHGKRASVELIVRVIACLAERLGIRGTARGFDVDPKTVLPWWLEAAEPLQAFSRPGLHDVRVRQGQWDELCALLSAVQAGEGSEADAIERLERSPQGGWVAREPERTCLLAIAVGERTRARAQRVGPQVAHVLAPDCAPRLLLAGVRESLTAVLPHDGPWGQPPRRQAHGPAPTPRWRPLSPLRSAPVGKTVRRRRLVRVRHRVGCGTLEAVAPGLATWGWQRPTAFGERLTLDSRQRGAAVGRRVTTLGKGEDGMRQQRALSQTSHTLCLPHGSLRQPVPPPEPINGTGSATPWRSWPPAMAAGLTDHLWTLREGRWWRGPPWPQPQARERHWHEGSWGG